ncbi:MAG: sensor histidine kinase [Thermoanaerobaculaceae bacterium]
MNFRWRLAAALAVTAGVTGLGALFLTWRGWDREAEAGLRERLLAMAIQVEKQLEQRWPLSAADLQSEVQLYSSLGGARITIIAGDGVVLADSRVPFTHLPLVENQRGRPEVEGALSAGRAFARRRSVTTGAPTLYSAVRVNATGEVFVVRAAQELRKRPWPWAGLASLLLGAIGVGVLGARLVGKVHARAFQYLAEWCDLPATAEVAALAYEADRRFRELREQLVREVEVCQQALAQVSEGVVILDRSLVIRFANAIARELLGPLTEGAHFWEQIRDPNVLAVLGQEGAPEEVRHGEVKVNDHTLAITVIPLAHPLLAHAVLIRDIGPQIRFEAARRAFVADLAHELRTPLAVISAVCEELKAEVENETLVAMLRRQLDRLIHFAEDLEELSRIESGALKLTFEPVDIQEVATEVVEDYAGMAAKRAVALRVVGESVVVTTDRSRLSQVLGNLVDNAIRYNRPGGSVTLRITPRDNKVEVTVEDTGIGIPKGEIPLVFQRFYRVKRGEGEVLGSGLGLAIVKHLVNSLGGHVELVSELGQGTKVTVTLPCEPLTG